MALAMTLLNAAAGAAAVLPGVEPGGVAVVPTVALVCADSDLPAAR